jgi:hypothetical protein
MKMRNRIWAMWTMTLAGACLFAVQAAAGTGPHVYVADFIVDQNASSQENVSERGVLGRFRPGILKERREELSVEQAQDLVELLSQSLVEELNAKGLPASRVSRFDKLEAKGVLVQGKFVELDEGDPLKRAAVGFKQGATNMEVAVMIDRLPLSGSPQEKTLDLKSSTGSKGPGGLLGVAICGNPYALAAKFVLSKRAPEKDVRKLAKEIAGEIQKYLQQ